jgi:hypothetical protein
MALSSDFASNRTLNLCRFKATRLFQYFVAAREFFLVRAESLEVSRAGPVLEFLRIGSR